MDTRRSHTSAKRPLVPDGQQSIWLGWPARWSAVLCAVAVTVGGLHLIPPTPPRVEGEMSPASAHEGFAEAAVAAFGDSAVGTDPSLSAQQRRAGLPVDPVSGLTSPTAAGPVQVVLPGGLGHARHTAGGQVVYPNAGAGFDMLAENTATGTRTVARINDPDGPRIVTTFVRTPVDTVMLAHTNGYLTINRATPAAETIGMFSPAETRDATGALVPSSYVVKRLSPQLYALTEAIDPRPDTAWPVYVDPPLHLTNTGGIPLPQGFFDSITNAVSSMADTVSSATATAVSATVSGAKAVGTFVKENPLESAMLVGGVALAVTGVGGPAGAAAIAAATVNLSSAGLDIAAAAMPDNKVLGNIATGFDIASALTPQGAAKKAVKEGVEIAGEQLAKHADDVVEVAKAAPTPPAQLADEVAATGAPKAPVPGVSTPKIPNGPPAKTPRDVPPGHALDCGCTTQHPAGVYDETKMGGQGPFIDHYEAAILDQPSPFTIATEAARDAHRKDAMKGSPLRSGFARDEKPLAMSADRGNGPPNVRYLNPRASAVEGNIWMHVREKYQLKPGDKVEVVFRDRTGQISCRDCAQRDLLKRQPQLRPSNPAQQRAIDADRVSTVTNRQRLNAVQKAGVISARENRNNDNGNRSASSSNKNRDQKKQKPKKDRKSKKHHSKPN
ncbi:HNH endonuclease [Mycobacterium sp. 48b]|uniref:HNH endonuclease n=1 Tax=Mycobacterium sp. 48b TaxID=3400426 RepID=UPI003AAB7FDB